MSAVCARARERFGLAAVAGAVAQERVLRGEDLRGVPGAHGEVLELPGGGGSFPGWCGDGDPMATAGASAWPAPPASRFRAS